MTLEKLVEILELPDTGSKLEDAKVLLSYINADEEYILEEYKKKLVEEIDRYVADKMKEMIEKGYSNIKTEDIINLIDKIN